MTKNPISRKSIRVLFAACAALVAAVGSPAAMADGQSVESIRVTGLQPYAGHALSVFYVSGREAAIGASGTSLVTRSIKAGPIRADISASGEVTIPASTIPRSGFEVANYALLIVHSASIAQIYVRNADGSIPSDPRLPGGDASSLTSADFAADRIAYVTLARLEQLKADQGGTSPITLDLNSLSR